MKDGVKITDKSVNIYSIVCIITLNIVACVLGIIGMTKEKVISTTANIISGVVFGIFWLIGLYDYLFESYKSAGAIIISFIFLGLNIALIVISAQYKKVAPKTFSYEVEGQTDNNEPFKYLK